MPCFAAQDSTSLAGLPGSSPPKLSRVGLSGRLDCEDELPGREEERVDGDTTQDSGFYSSPGLGLHLDMELDSTLPR